MADVIAVQCLTCDEVDPSMFGINRARKTGRNSYCKRCNRERASAWRAANPEKAVESNVRARQKFLETHGDRWYNIKKRYNLPQEEWQAMFDLQNGLCANPACSGPAEVVDHDHSCCSDRGSCGECVRGLLCGPCNKAEGFLRSNSAVALGLAEYMMMGVKE